jgi:hypothetical protein
LRHKYIKDRHSSIADGVLIKDLIKEFGLSKASVYRLLSI